jgi:hypothetical protein
MDTWKLPAEFQSALRSLQTHLHERLDWRLPLLVAGIVFAQGRRTVTSWLRAAGVGADFRTYYYCLSSLGGKASWCAISLLHLLLSRLDPGPRWLFALDDTPTQRYGPCVEGAGHHHHPSPGPTDQKFLYGHVWVTLAWLVRHPRWGTLAFPLWSQLYVRLRDVAALVPWYGWRFRTKLQLAGAMLGWLNHWLPRQGKPVWVVVDGFYAKKEFLREARRQQMVVVGRLRKDAALRSLPPAGPRGRGRPRIYGTERISLIKRAAHRHGWQRVWVRQYGEERLKTVKTFLATWPPAGGAIRVVLVREPHGWLAYACTDVEASVEDILAVAADRGAIEQTFHDIKEVHGAGEQQVRNLWANIGAWHLVLWVYALIEWWAWNRREEELCDRSASPWDDPTRRPSHADKHKALQRQCLEEEFSAAGRWQRCPPKIRRAVERLLKLVA